MIRAATERRSDEATKDAMAAAASYRRRRVPGDGLVRHTPCCSRSAVRIALIACLLSASSAAADEIQTVTHARYVAVRIEDVKDGKIIFRDVQGRTAERAIADVRTLMITGWEAFNRAEASLAARQYRQAAREFEAILREVEQAGPDVGRPRHRRDLVLARFAAACDGEGRFDRAVEAYIALCKAWGAGAEGLEPKSIPPRESAFHAAATEALAAAVSEAGGTAAGDLLRRYRDRLSGKPATQSASRPAVVKPVVKPDPHRREGRRETDPRLAQVSRWIDAGQTDRAAKLIDAVLRSEPAERLAPWYYRLGRCLEVAAKNDEDRLRAALAYMRVPVHYPADALCAECLYRAAMIHIRIGRADRATGLLREALRHSPSADLKAQCEQALRGVGR